MKPSWILPILGPPLLAVLAAALTLALFSGGMTAWIAVPIAGALIVASGQLKWGWFSVLDNLDKRGMALMSWCWICLCAVPLLCRAGETMLETAAFDAPRAFEPKLAAWKAAHGQYPESLTVIAPYDLRRLRLEYRSNGRLYEFTLTKVSGLRSELWIYDGTTHVWSREE